VRHARVSHSRVSQADRVIQEAIWFVATCEVYSICRGQNRIGEGDKAARLKD
jgi:hypothetical protein